MTKGTMLFNCVFVLLALTAFRPTAGTTASPHETDLIEGSYIVVLDMPEVVDAGTPPHQEHIARYVANTAVELAVRFRFEVVHVYSHALIGFSISRATDDTIRHLLRDRRVAFVEQDRRVFDEPLQVYTATSVPPWEPPPWGAPDHLNAGFKQTNPPWNLDRIDQRNLPLNDGYFYSTAATNVRVYVFDTGIRATHQEFSGRVLPGADIVNDGHGTDDCRGHGTSVAGVIGGVTYGVAKGVRLVPVRVRNCKGIGSASLTAAALDWVAANHVLPAVANMSLSHELSPAVDLAAKKLIALGVTVVTSAGNKNDDACNYSPNAVPGMITVGASTTTDARWPSSNYGACVHIFAPGDSVYTASRDSDSATHISSGTSMAAPHVAGVAALWLSTYPWWTPAQIANKLSERATYQRLTAIGPGSPNRLLYSR